jgi:hypothetical protein
MITVSAPDNITVQFPDGTDAEIIHRVMAQHFGSPEIKAKYAPITTDDLVRQAAKGIPILGGAMDKFAAGMDALTHGVLGRGSDAPSIGERYAANLENEQARDTRFETEHPIASTVAGIAGGVGATLPVAATASGARMLGLGGRTLSSQVGAGALSGAGVNAVDAFVRGGDPLTAGAVGGVIGGAAPAVARGIGAVASPIVNTARGIINPSAEASRIVGAAIERDAQAGAAGLTQPEFASAAAGGAPVNLMDLGGETTRGVARAAANTSPEGRQVLNRALDDRYQSQADRLTGWLNSTFNYPNEAAQQQALRQSQSAANNANYARAMADGAEGIWSPELERLASSGIVSDAMKKAASVAQDEAVMGGYGGMNPKVSFTADGRIQFGRGPTGTPAYPDLQFWDLTRRQLSNGAQMAARAGDMEGARRFGTFAQRLNAELDSRVPSYAAARAGHATFAGAQDALEAGRNYATQGRIDNRAARTALMGMTPQERGLFQDGFVSALTDKIRSMPDRRNVAGAIANSPAAQEQMQIALGPQRARELQAMLHLENVMNAAHGAVQGNSTTVRQLAELGLVGTGGSILGGSNPLTDPASVVNAALIYGALRHGSGAALATVDQRVATQAARLLASNDPAQIRFGMNILGRNGGLLDGLRRADVALARAGAAQTNQPNQNRRLQ